MEPILTPTPPPRRKKSIVKRTGIGLLATLLLLIVAAVVIAAFFQQAVGKKLISELNKQLKTELKVGSFDLSFIKGFPDATVTLKEVSLMGTNRETLLEAQEASFHFRLLSLFEKSVKVHSVTIRDGALDVHTDKRGYPNYDIFKPSKSASGTFAISIEKARLENIELIYRDEKLRQETRQLVQTADFSGDFSDKKYELASVASLESQFLDVEDVRYFGGKKWGYDAQIFVDVVKGTYDFKKVIVRVEDNSFDVGGSIRSQKDAKIFDLKATADDASLESVVALMPEQYRAALGDFSSTGRFKFVTTVKGKQSANEQPAIEMSVSLSDGKLSSPRLAEPFKDVSFEMSFTNGVAQGRQSFFEISDFKGYLNRQLITLALRVENLSDPRVELSADGIVPLGDVYGLFNNPAITGGNGNLEFKNLKVNGMLKDMRSVNNVIAVNMSGDISLDDASLKFTNEEIVFDRGDLHFENNLLTLTDLKLEGAGSEINLKGHVRNLLPVLLSDSLNSENAELTFSAELYAPKLDAGRLVKLTDVPVQEGEVKQEVFDSLKVENTATRTRITDLLKGEFLAKVDEFHYGKIEGENFNGKLVFENRQMRVLGDTKAMQGAFEVDGTLFFEKEPRLEAQFSGEGIDVKEFFEQTGNAGQTLLTAENLEGVMTSKMLIHAFWDSTGNFLMDKLHVWAGIGIKNGELNGFKMLEEFAAYAKIQDLRRVRFTDLQNWFEVKDNTFYLPALFIRNNAMNMTVGGEQSFDGKIDYGIKVNAGQVLANKFKKNNSKLDPIEAKENGFFNLYFSIFGTLEKYKYETARKKVKEQFKRSERQKQDIRRALIKAFGAPLNMLREPEGWLDEGEAAVPESEDEYIPGF